MTLLLNGEQIVGHRMKLTANLKIEADELGGQTSATDKSHKGFKPKTLTVALTIPYKALEDLRAIMRLAEATAGGGQLQTYRIVNDTAKAFGIRQVTFSDGVSAREDDTLAQWIVQFTLSEKLSNPEKVENRRAGNGVTSQSAPGDGVAGSGSGTPEELTGFEAVLKKVDTYLGGTP
ncbi:DNA-binding protein [Pseudomonas syringae]|uniref:DNA-binding protein n=1 Tax=Pseudomonas syringae TaxID=317 RepID=A0AB37ZL48_PSESX|nr:DNA-binding protein [Pseudomonas syringae]MBI6669048.1 DNA-binding protein [Pseudomonas syringae]MBI6676677.1 DNA-binding protein [Pseudomonas syringae]MBI6839886.1 DNA-binding protein [Pseudomonas syringae]NAP21412.1 DNA-binding protein [Pseudomonas syringae]NAQ15700.1 DNA-binding protein [Pseudomonas syringae]